VNANRQILVNAIILLAIGATFRPAFALQRGAWFWYQSSDPNGAANVVGNAAAENDAIAFFQQWEITRVYGSYSNLTTTSAAALGAWNKKLAQAGIESYVVLSDATLVLPAEQFHLQSLVNSRFVTFNNGRSDPEQRFVGIEMDLEPHTLPEWSSGTNSSRRDLLFNMRDAYANVRTTATAGGYASTLLSAALPVWFDTSSTVGWANAAERGEWFDDIATTLDSISLMAYETSSVASILTSTDYERSEVFDQAQANVALRSKLGEEWTTYNDFKNATSSVEAMLGAGIDIESYYRLRQILPTPILAGDYNADDAVSAADYVLWRRGNPLQNDPTPGVGPADYATWQAHFGEPASGVGSTINVPEPKRWTCLLILACSAGLQRWAPLRATRAATQSDHSTYKGRSQQQS
jgi:hypothetical protein